MLTILEENWRHRMTSSRLRKDVAFQGDELVFGCGTVLWKAESRLSRTISLQADVAYDRLVALLVVAGRGHLVKASMLQFDAVLNDWRRGERALAAIRLAFIPLPKIHDLDDAHMLFLAETALDTELSAGKLLNSLGYAGCLPLLKDYRTQPRVPGGSGRESGQWTSEALGVTFAPEIIPAAFKPADEGLKPIPAFLPTEDGEEQGMEDKARHLLDDSVVIRPRNSHDLPQMVPGGFAIVPEPDIAAPTSPGPAVAPPSPPMPAPAPVPIPIPRLAPVGGGSSSDGTSRDEKGPACPKQENDVANGVNESGDNEEYLLSLLINPESPTPKNSTWTPNVQSKAYFLPSPAPRGRTSFDDCKQQDTPTTLPIPGLRPGDMVEIKAGGWGWELWARGSAAFEQFKTQAENQNAAVVAEGRGRQIYYCVPSQTKAEKAANLFAYLTNSHFLVCH